MITRRYSASGGGAICGSCGHPLSAHVPPGAGYYEGHCGANCPCDRGPIAPEYHTHANLGIDAPSEEDDGPEVWVEIDRHGKPTQVNDHKPGYGWEHDPKGRAVRYVPASGLQAAERRIAELEAERDAAMTLLRHIRPADNEGRVEITYDGPSLRRSIDRALRGQMPETETETDEC